MCVEKAQMARTRYNRVFVTQNCTIYRELTVDYNTAVNIEHTFVSGIC